MKTAELRPSIVVTGASGFIGRHFLDATKGEYRIFAIARRSRGEAGVPYHPNIHWIQTDLSNRDSVCDTADYIIAQGGADYCLHLAAFYDFTGKDNPEYTLTNVEGTRNVLDMSRRLAIRRFLFVSSIAACKFGKTFDTVNETTPADADFPYAKSKFLGEELTRSYSEYFPCSNVRLAAVFSDWCEYPPVYKFLGTWLSAKYDSRILAGRGTSAVPYIFVQDVLSLFQAILHQSNSLPRYDTYLASPDGSTSHRELYDVATHYCFGTSHRALFLPKFLAYAAIPTRQLMNRLSLRGEEAFERLWMVPYIDRKLHVDASYTRQALNWQPTPRYGILRRLLFILERMKSHPEEWRIRNEAALKAITHRSNLVIYEQLLAAKQSLLKRMAGEILSPEGPEPFKRYALMNDDDFRCYMSAIYHLLMAAVRSGDRGLMLDYIEDIALRRFAEGFTPEHICAVLSLFNERITAELMGAEKLKKLGQEVFDYVGMTIQLAKDRVEDLYLELVVNAPPGVAIDSELLPDCKKLQDLIRQLSAFYQVFPEEYTQS